MKFAIEGVAGVAVFLLFGWTFRWLLAISWQAIMAREWHSRGLGAKDVFVAASIITGLAWAGVLTLGVLGGWLLARFAPAAWAWVAGSWGVRAGFVAGLVAQAIRWFGAAGRELAERLRAGYFQSHCDDLPKRLTARQEAYVRHYRQLAERLAAEAEGDPSEGAESPEDGDGRLAFAIEAAASRQALRDASPGFEPGGDWSVLTCRLEHESRPARFFLAERSGAPGKDLPMAWGEGRLWTAGASDAETLLAAFRAAFPSDEQAEPGTVSGGMITASTVVLARGVGRQPDCFSGKGTWTASKWAFEEVDEVYVNWSAAEKRGEFAEKDEAYRAGLLSAVAALAER
jgi:hypothetical protein